MISLLLLGMLPFCLGAKILGINPSASYSHQMPFLAVMRHLAERGHDVTVVTTDPLKNPPANFTQIDISVNYKALKDTVDFIKGTEDPGSIIAVLQTLTDNQLDSPQIQQLARSSEKYDVIVLEVFFAWSFLGLVSRLGSPPLIGFSTTALSSITSHLMGNPHNPAYVPNLSTDFSDHMSFMQRLVNAYEALKELHTLHAAIMPQEDQQMRKYFGEDLPPILDLAYNFSLLFTSADFSIGYPIPTQPNIVQLVGLNIQKNRKSLPKDIQDFLDSAEHGVVYMSLGSNVKSKQLSEDKRRALMKAFSSLPQRVLWKFEDDSLPGKPDNVKIVKWLPQQDVLAHPNVRLFVTQGGLQSMSEATYFGVPLVGIPIFGEQAFNVAKMVAAGIGMKLDFKDISEQSVLKALETVLENPSYSSNMRRLSYVFREQQQDSLDRAARWIEYVIRHNGAKHLRPASLDLAWYQLLLLDVALFVVAVASAVLFIIYQVLKVIGRKLFGRHDIKLKKQ